MADSRKQVLNLRTGSGSPPPTGWINTALPVCANQHSGDCHATQYCSGRSQLLTVIAQQMDFLVPEGPVHSRNIIVIAALIAGDGLKLILFQNLLQLIINDNNNTTISIVGI